MYQYCVLYWGLISMCHAKTSSKFECPRTKSLVWTEKSCVGKPKHCKINVLLTMYRCVSLLCCTSFEYHLICGCVPHFRKSIDITDITYSQSSRDKVLEAFAGDNMIGATWNLRQGTEHNGEGTQRLWCKCTELSGWASCFCQSFGDFH